MDKKICDRCQREINTNPMMQCKLTARVIYSHPNIYPIDLCECCTAEFEKWIKESKE